MRLAIVGDLHLGAGADLALNPSLTSRLEEQAQMWVGICRRVAEANVDLLLCTGDCFHRRRPTPSELLAFRRGLDALESVPVLAIPGNHDVATASEPNALSVFDRDLMLVTEPRVVHLPKLWLSVGCLPWTPPQWYRAQHAEADGDTNTAVAWLLERAARGLSAQCETGFRVLLHHWSMSGARLPNGKPVDDLAEPKLAVAELGEWSMICAGHIHKAQSIPNANVPCFYQGTPWMIDWGEVSEPHGWVLVDTAGEAPRHVATEGENLYLALQIDLVEAIEQARRAERTLIFQDELERAAGGRAGLEGRIVRLRYRCTESQRSAIDESELRRLLVEMGAARVYSVGAEVQKAEREKVKGVDETLGPLDALGAWLDSERVEAPMREQLVGLAAGYLEAVE